jgi:hypothetical protein
LIVPKLADMPEWTYNRGVPVDKPLIWLRGEVRSPAFSRAARVEAGERGDFRTRGRCEALRPAVTSCESATGHNWRIVLRVDPGAIVIAEVFDKKSRTTPAGVIASCQRRLAAYGAISPGGRR